MPKRYFIISITLIFATTNIKKMLITLLLTVIILVICAVLLGIKIIFVKGGQFPNTHIGGNKALGKKGIHCSSTQDREAYQERNLFERLEEIKE